MMVKQSFVLFLFVGVSLYKPAQSVLCRNTSITANLRDPEIRHEIVEDILRRFFSSPNAPHLSSRGSEAIDYVLRLYNGTDSPLLRRQIEAFARFSYSLIFWVDPAKGDWCSTAEAINASALYVRNQNNRELIPVINGMSAGFERSCLRVAALILRDMGCKKLPDIPCYKGPKCLDGGAAFDYQDVLNGYGQYIPCQLKEIITRLYESSKTEDKALAASLTISFTLASVASNDVYAIEKMFELTNMLSDPREKTCCCRARRTRLLEICEVLGDTNVDPIRNLFTTECPPEAAYQK